MDLAAHLLRLVADLAFIIAVSATVGVVVSKILSR